MQEWSFEKYARLCRGQHLASLTSRYEKSKNSTVIQVAYARLLVRITADIVTKLCAGDDGSNPESDQDDPEYDEDPACDRDPLRRLARNVDSSASHLDQEHWIKTTECLRTNLDSNGVDSTAEVKLNGFVIGYYHIWARHLRLYESDECVLRGRLDGKTSLSLMNLR